VSGTVTVSVAASGGSGYTYTVKAGTATIYNGTNASFSWNSAGTANGSVTLTATATDSGGASGSTTRTVTVSNTATSTGGGGGTTGATDTENVVWVSPVKVAVDGNSITKNAGCNGCWDAGAFSQQTIASGDGSVEFKTAGGNGTTVGLGPGSAGTSGNEIKYGLRFFPGYVEVRESGAYKADWPVAAGAGHKISIENGVVKYYLNGALKYISTQAPSYPLALDSSLAIVGDAVQGAVITR
jgi:hypothetical protein